MAIDLDKKALLWPSGQDNMGGHKQHLLFIPADAVSAVPELPATVAANADYVTATGAFTFKVTEGGKPKVIYCSPNTVKSGADNQGEFDGQSFAQKGEFFHPGNQVEAAAFSRFVNNTPGYLVLEDKQGVQTLVGQPGMYCYIKPAYDGGQKTADRRGYKFTYESDCVAPVIFLGTPIDIEALIV